MQVRELDIDIYLTQLENERINEKEKVYSEQLANYREFVKELVSSNKILTRNFYIVIPHFAEMGAKFDFVKEQLTLKKDILIKGLESVGLKAETLSSLEILKYFYNFYNDNLSKTQPISNESLDKKWQVESVK